MISDARKHEKVEGTSKRDKSDIDCCCIDCGVRKRIAPHFLHFFRIIPPEETFAPVNQARSPGMLPPGLMPLAPKFRFSICVYPRASAVTKFVLIRDHVSRKRSAPFGHPFCGGLGKPNSRLVSALPDAFASPFLHSAFFLLHSGKLAEVAQLAQVAEVAVVRSSSVV